VIYTHVATAILSASLSFYGGWTVNQWRHDAHEKQAIEAAALDQQELHRMEQRRSAAALATQVMARKSEARLRADAAASQSALVGLQSSTDEALRTAAADHATCTAVSNSLGELFTASADRYRSVAAQADQCGIDLRVQINTP
jgi:hypothetical protein